MNTLRRLASTLAALLLAAGLARANCGPVACQGGTGQGNVVSRQQTQVRLVSEKLVIRLDDDLVHYDVDARYVLANAGAPVSLQLGVPLRWVDEEDPAVVARRIELLLEGRRINLTSALKREATPEDLPPIECSDAEGHAWAVGDAVIPSGDAVALRLRYRGQLRFDDQSCSKQPLTHYGDRQLHYELDPAGYWAGTPDRLDVAVELGRRALWLSSFAPDGGRLEGTTLTWHVDRPDLRALRAIDVIISAQAPLQQPEIAAWYSTVGRELMSVTVRASSALAPQGRATYGADRLIDGNERTAWCEGVPGNGVGEWIELEVEARQQPSRRDAFDLSNSEWWVALLAGLAKDDETYQANGRVTRIRVAPCADPEGGVVLDLRQADLGEDDTLDLVHHDACSVARSIEPPGQRWFGPCVRVIILEVQPGSRYDDTCLSELVYLPNLG